jgi:hypothetical protein
MVPVVNRYAFSAVQASVRSTWTNVESIFALQAYIAPWTHAMFKIFTVRLLQTTIQTIFFERANIFGPFAANALICTSQLAFRWRLSAIFEFAHRANVPFLAIAAKMSVLIQQRSKKMVSQKYSTTRRHAIKENIKNMHYVRFTLACTAIDAKLFPIQVIFIAASHGGFAFTVVAGVPTDTISCGRGRGRGAVTMFSMTSVRLDRFDASATILTVSISALLTFSLTQNAVVSVGTNAMLKIKRIFPIG